MFRRAPWIILIIMAIAIAINIGLIFDETTSRQAVIVINMGFLFGLGVGSALFAWEVEDAYLHLKDMVEKLQTPGGYLREDLEIEEQPDKAFLKELDHIAHEAQARMQSAVD